MHDLTGCDVQDAKEETNKPYSFKIYYPGDSKKKTLLVIADSQEDMKDWMDHIKVCLYLTFFVLCIRIII